MGDENPSVDQVKTEDREKNSELEDNLKSRDTWLRLVFMVIYYVIISLASLVGCVVVALGFLWVLVTGEVNRQLKQVGQSLAGYIYEIVRYLTFNTDQKPFPFGGDWPSGTSDE